MLHANESARTSMHVAHIVPALFGPDGIVGGAERYAYELARHMAREVTTKLLTFAFKSDEFRDGELSIKVIGRPWNIRGQRTNPIALKLLGELHEADVVHCHQRHVMASTVAALFSRATRRRCFVTDLGGGGWDISAYFNTDTWFDGHLHISNFSRTSSGHHNNPRAQVVYGGVDTERFSPSETTYETNRVSFVGRIFPHKGIDVLLQALPEDMTLQVIGREVDSRYLADLQQMAVRKRVSFRLGCSDDELISAYRETACVVLPSVTRTRYGVPVPASELLGQTLLEAMACGKPVVCTAVGGMPEVVEEGVTGFVVPPSEPDALSGRLNWIRDHPREASRMGTAGRAHVLDKFTWPQVVRRCLDVYRGQR